MKPYRSHLRTALSLCVILGILVSVLALPATAAAGKRKSPKGQKNGPVLVPRHAFDPVTRKGYEHFYNMEYDKALREFEQVAEAHPDDPFALNHLIAGVLFKELYRIGAIDTELYANDSFLDSRHFPVDAKVRARIRELTDRSLALCEARLQADPNDVDALYARGVARGMRSTTMGLMDKAWFAALRSAIGARRDHERVLDLDPNYTDAKFLVGVHNYVLGSLSWAVKAAASVVGLSGSKQKGIQYLYDAANANGEASVDAKIALSLFLRREQRYTEAIDLVGGLVHQYPRNFLVALEHANLLNAAGRGPDAITAYRKLLAGGEEGLYVDPRLEQAAYGLGEALRGQRDFKGAVDAYERVSSFAHVDPELQIRANLGAGEMYDLLQQREQALNKYRTVIAADSDSPRANAARKHLKQAYTLPKG